jgi:hypothetical protein
MIFMGGSAFLTRQDAIRLGLAKTEREALEKGLGCVCGNPVCRRPLKARSHPLEKP